MLYPRRTVDLEIYFDYTHLYSDEFAPYYGIEDPAMPGTYLNLCEIMEGGFAHELWVVGSADVPDARAWEVVEYKQEYNSQGNKIPGQFNPCAGNGCVDGNQ